jgi:hypothetical protein
MTLPRDVLARLIPFFRYLVAAQQADCPIALEGETEPLGWWLRWKVEPDHLTVLTALPTKLARDDREEVLLAVATLPGVRHATVKGKSSPFLVAEISFDPSDLSDLSDWLRRWHVEVEAEDW